MLYDDACCRLSLFYIVLFCITSLDNLCDFFTCFVNMLRSICFFMQKTADEWRISDWSSDVCSSDLGFDAVEVHGAHGYLLDQFLRDSVNDRDDAYGGTLENRSRLLLEVVDQAIAAFGAGRVGVRISPLVSFNDIADSDPRTLVQYVAAQLTQRSIAFLELRHNQPDAEEDQEIGRAHV